jgi:adenylosuccinate synthase
MATVVDPVILAEEMEWRPEARVLLDPRATILEQELDRSQEENADLVNRLGSTGKGIGSARSRRIMRTAGTAGDYPYLPPGVELVDTSAYIRRKLLAGNQVMFEGSQGQGLSLFSSGHYPKVTTGECGPLQMATDAGLTPHSFSPLDRWIGVYRTCPIRVAGNSGDLLGETTWDYLRNIWGDHIPEERTTVTNKVRRVGTWDARLARKTARYMGITEAALTFLDYPFPELAGATQQRELIDNETANLYVRERELDIGSEITLVGTGFGTYIERKSHHNRNET